MENQYPEIRMEMTPNETLFAGNNASYQVYIRNDKSNSRAEIARFDVRQIYGRQRGFEDAFILEENPQTQYGVFVVKKYEYTPSKMKPMGIRFTPTSAHKMARNEAMKFAKRLKVEKGLSEIIDAVDSDIKVLIERVKEIKE
jgi:hypothetical protein